MRFAGRNLNSRELAPQIHPHRNSRTGHPIRSSRELWRRPFAVVASVRHFPADCHRGRIHKTRDQSKAQFGGRTAGSRPSALSRLALIRSRSSRCLDPAEEQSGEVPNHSYEPHNSSVWDSAVDAILGARLTIALPTGSSYL